MTQTGYSSALVNLMLGWLKGLASWVLKLFNLASGASPLLWLSENWLKLLILCLIVGLAMDWLVWLIRWRPYWVWFRKQRIVVNDERFLSETIYEEDDEREGVFEKRYVVPSTIVKRQPKPKTAARTSAAKSAVPKRRRAPATTVSRSKASSSRRQTAVARTRPAAGRPAVQSVRRPQPARDVFSDELFEVGRTQEEFPDFYEDEVFDVSNLPEASGNVRKGKKRRR